VSAGGQGPLERNAAERERERQLRERRRVGAPRAGASGGRPRRRLVRRRIGAAAALIAAVLLVLFLVALFQPFAGPGSGRVVVAIPKGASARRVGSILAKDGVVPSGVLFDLRALLEGKRGELHSGRYELRHDMSYAAAIDALSKPPPAAIIERVVIPEGFTRMQTAALARSDYLSGDYLAASRRSPELDPRSYGAPAQSDSLEGFLFPATYEIPAGAPARRLVSQQLLAFRERFSAALRRRARALGLTPYELLIVASMVEREAKVPADRPRIAAVIYNRLRRGMLLGVDATVYYAIELQRGIATYTGPLSTSLLRIDSPYNTRTHRGLPPTPISNPGLASIEAAARPARVPYLYYVAAADGCGEHVFSSTYAEFQADVAAYDAALSRNHGQLPACKRK